MILKINLTCYNYQILDEIRITKQINHFSFVIDSSFNSKFLLKTKTPNTIHVLSIPLHCQEKVMLSHLFGRL